MFHRNRSFWFDSAPPYRPNEPLKAISDVDVCIIGGGITGLSTAYHLLRKDPTVSVALLESEIVGFGASGRNAGQLIVAFGEGDFRGQLRRYGAQRLQEAYAYVYHGIQTIEALITEHCIECDYTRTGTLFVGLRCDKDEQVQDYLAFNQRINQGAYLETMRAEDVADEINSPYFGSAVFDRRGGQFNPLKLVRGIKGAAEKLGAQIYEQSPVVRIERNTGCIVLRTGTGQIRCKKLVLATNAYSHLLHGLQDQAISRNQSPVFVYANITAPLTSEQWQRLKWPRRCGVNVLSDLFYSFAPTLDGRILYVGGYYADIPKDNEMFRDISADFMAVGPKNLSAFFPTLDGIPTSQSWGGPISTTRDYVPHIGVLDDDRISYANGCWGHGMPLGAQNGRTLAELALGQNTERTMSWLITRSKANWPSRSFTPLVINCIASMKRYSSRRTARRMDARFELTD